ncbi:unnamed protein product [Amoebophrya sp. A25]|nr:unnamed protein product [Amoebophrya sp. A25]|eukprot:GSA25T00013189001.1
MFMLTITFYSVAGVHAIFMWAPRTLIEEDPQAAAKLKSQVGGGEEKGGVRKSALDVVMLSRQFVEGEATGPIVETGIEGEGEGHETDSLMETDSAPSSASNSPQDDGADENDNANTASNARRRRGQAMRAEVRAEIAKMSEEAHRLEEDQAIERMNEALRSRHDDDLDDTAPLLQPKKKNRCRVYKKVDGRFVEVDQA